jgi:hypothetical protein
VSCPTDMSRLMGKAFVLLAVSIKQPFISIIVIGERVVVILCSWVFVGRCLNFRHA